MIVQYAWWIAKAVLALACLGFAGVGIYIAIKRRRPLVMPMAAFVVLMLALACLQLASGGSESVGAHWQLIVAGIGAVAGAVGAISFTPLIRQLLSQPTREQIAEVNAALERANRELEAFTASVSHDLRSPLTTIAGQAGLLEMSAGAKLDEDQKRRLRRIHASVKQMSELIEALLNLSRISQAKVDREVVDVSSVAEHIINDLSQHDPGRKVDVHIAPSLTLHADRRLITSVLENLINNAWKFTSKTGCARIEVSSALLDNRHCICVRDNGCGFEMTHHDKLFHPFQRLHTQAEFPGSGVGLATASRIIARHGGRLWAQSHPGEGATFCFTVE